MKTSNSRNRHLRAADLKVPALLVLLSIVPMLGGVARLMHMSNESALSPENARFVQAPVPILIHIFSATVFCILGAFQFSRAFRLRWPGLHRRMGRVLGVCGLLAGATGLWMTASYAIPASMQGPLLYPVRMAVGASMIAAIIVAWQSILHRDVARHEAYMIRAYALGQGAGTQVIVLLPWMLLSGQSGGLTRDLLMTLSWLINVLFAEVVIKSRNRAPLTTV